ncbi:hypothetical protein AY599_18340 [Leptolyngbya valderiana BDU 20041]|nr:hypothetical protein AY599_18340 [Leptolyngbya valderiana BDU 20041]
MMPTSCNSQQDCELRSPSLLAGEDFTVTYRRTSVSEPSVLPGRSGRGGKLWQNALGGISGPDGIELVAVTGRLGFEPNRPESAQP